MNSETPRKTAVMRAVQTALLGEVSCSLRVVQVSYDEQSISVNCYYDGAISEEDEESVSVIETEILAMFPSNHVVMCKAIRLDWPATVPKIGNFAFSRRE